MIFKEILMKKRFFTLLLVIALILPVLVSCGDSSAPPAQETQTEAPSDQSEPVSQPAPEDLEPIEEPDGYTLPMMDTETIISFATIDNQQATYSYGVDYPPAWEEFTRRTNVKIDFQVIDTASYNENMQTRLAAGINLPDILRLPPDSMQYAESGVIIPMNDLIAKYAPNIVRLFNDQPNIRAALTAPDGNIYYIGAVLNARAIVNYNFLNYRKDWFDKLGLTELKTIDDWTAFFTGVRDNDVSGSGLNDEIPFTGNDIHALNMFGSAFGLQLDTLDGTGEIEYFQLDDNGRVLSMWTDPRLKDFLAQMNYWYEEGFIDRDMVGTQPGDATNAKIHSNRAASYLTFTMQAPQNTSLMAEEFPGAYFEVPSNPPIGPNGDHFLLRERPVSGEHYAISRDCSDPALAMKVYDYIYANPEGQILLTNFGIEGITFEYVDGVPKHLPLIADDPRGDGAALWDYGMNGAWPRILMPEFIQGRFFRFPQSENAASAAANYQIDMFPAMIPTREETQTFQALLPDINTYRQEMISAFITGRESLDNFDTYVSTIENMGMNDLVALKQSQYDRVFGR